jgi:hypothetical protein
MTKPKFICAQPDDDYYLWQVHLWLESLKNIGSSEQAVVLIFTPFGRNPNKKWETIQKLYPEAEFFFKQGEKEVNGLIRLYIPIIRPYILKEYFKANPDAKNHNYFYCDSDIIFMDNFDVSKYYDDAICYLSDTKSYINATYFDSKKKDVIPDKLAEYEKIDVLGEITKVVGISREIAEKYNQESGGAQYLLKNIDADFWEKVEADCIKIRVYLQQINKAYFENENKGFQSWCSDMWAVLWNLWYFGHETKIVPEMNFAWSSDPIAKLQNASILHNAGIVSNEQNGTPVFYKGYFHTGNSPYNDPHVQKIAEMEPTLCNHIYVKELFKLKQKYNP